MLVCVLASHPIPGVEQQARGGLSCFLPFSLRGRKRSWNVSSSAARRTCVQRSPSCFSADSRQSEGTTRRGNTAPNTPLPPPPPPSPGPTERLLTNPHLHFPADPVAFSPATRLARRKHLTAERRATHLHHEGRARRAADELGRLGPAWHLPTAASG